MSNNNRDELDFLEFKKLKQQKQEYLEKYGYTEKQKFNKIIDLLTEIKLILIKDKEVRND